MLDAYRRRAFTAQPYSTPHFAVADMGRALEHGAQTPEGEVDLEQLMRSVAS